MTELPVKLTDIDRGELHLIGTFCEIRWTATNVMAKRQCEKCVYVVRGLAGPMVGVELVYDSIEGLQRHNSIFWVPVEAIQSMRVLSMAQAQARMDRLEKEAFEQHPKD